MANGKWKGLEPEYVLLGGIVKQAIRDSEQASDEKLRMEAWEFLQVCAPTLADKLRKATREFPDKQGRTGFTNRGQLHQKYTKSTPKKGVGNGSLV